ncbi:MAG TPA: hypothetical protein VEQ41_00785 [Solirubrobacterales bacterium]|nr:hypothetical protein [Solirubrobacterales bacterium]
MSDWMARSEPEPDFLARAKKWLSEKWGADRECPYCASSAWQVLGVVDLKSSNLTEDPDVPDDAMYPAIQVACENCGQTVLVNVLATGIVDRPAGSSPAGEKGNNE